MFGVVKAESRLMTVRVGSARLALMELSAAFFKGCTLPSDCAAYEFFSFQNAHV
jgi:hypothetical protein